MPIKFEDLAKCMTGYNSQRKKFIYILSIIIIIVLFIIYCGSALTVVAGFVGYEINKKENPK